MALLVLGVAAGAVLFSYYQPATLTLESDQKTTDALALVKTALIGWTVKRGDISGNPRPGELPCPDTRAPTDSLYGTQDSSCNAGELGRVPWRTLGIPEPKDSAGETLWYAVAGPFLTRAANNDNPLNSDTRGNITVYDADGTTVLTSQAAAVIFAPGRVLGTQNRSTTSVSCATTGTTIARNRCAANYLETGPNNRNNAAASNTPGTFINGHLSATFNDRVVYLITPEFMPSVEKRVASEVKTWLDGYRANSTCQCYPWAADFTINTGNAASPNYDTQSDEGRNRGRFPVKDGNKADPEDWTSPRPILPYWFTYNNWNTVIYYALARQNAEGQGLSPVCTTCTGATLTVDGKLVISAVFFTPGTPLTGITRPSNTLANYLQDAENNDNDDDTYITPTATTPDRDRLYTSVSAPAAIDADEQCGEMGEALRKLAACGQPPKLNPQCAALAGTDPNGVPLLPPQGLQLCSVCAAAAQVLVNVPCQNTLKPAVCRAAYRTLDNC